MTSGHRPLNDQSRAVIALGLPWVASFDVLDAHYSSCICPVPRGFVLGIVAIAQRHRMESSIVAVVVPTVFSVGLGVSASNQVTRVRDQSTTKQQAEE
jgi:hypothetical protein